MDDTRVVDTLMLMSASRRAGNVGRIAECIHSYVAELHLHTFVTDVVMFAEY